MSLHCLKQAKFIPPAQAGTFFSTSTPLNRAINGRKIWDSAPLADLRPTQMAIGMRAVEAKRQKVEREAGGRRRLRRFLEKRPIPIVVGPDDEFYLIDHHHLCVALWLSDVEEVFIRVVSDLSDLRRTQFLRSMRALGWLHSFDAKGQEVCPTRIPQSIDKLRSDPFRDLAWSVRRAGGFQKTSIPFVEFAWANYFRQNIPLRVVRNGFEEAHALAMTLARSSAARRLPGFLEQH